MDYLQLGGQRRGFTPRASVSSSITHRYVVLVFVSLFPLTLPFIFCCECDFNWLSLFTNSVYSLCSFSAHLLFVIKFELVFLLLGSKRSRVFYTLFELSFGIRAGTLLLVSLP